MKAIHWVRSRQEERELAFWLSIVSFDHRDHSFTNRIYFLYLILFFSVWVFVTLTFFASGGSILLSFINPGVPISAAMTIETLIIGIWNTISLRQSLKRSPVIFSEQDATLICQMPVNPRFVTLRWLLLPWLKSVIPISLLAIMLGFSLAEIALPGSGVSHLPEYAGYGFRALLAIVPIHLGLFVMQWVVGIYGMQKSHQRRWLAGLFVILSILITLFLLRLSQNMENAAQIPWNNLAMLILYPLQAGFGLGDVWVTLPISISISVIVLGFLYLVSGKFLLSQAAEETHALHTLNSALQFGFTSLGQQLKTKQKLGITRSPTRLPALVGEKVLIWKDILQSQRSFEILSLTNWVTILGLMISISFLSDLSSRALLFTIWVITTGKVSVKRLRSDLSCWVLVRQFPFSHKEFIIHDLFMSFFLTWILSLAGLGIGAVLSGNPVSSLAFLIPGVTAGVAGMAASDVIRRSRSDLLVDGLVPEIGAGGIILGLLFTGIPLSVHALFSGILWFSLSFLLSILLGIGAFYIASTAYRNIGRT